MNDICNCLLELLDTERLCCRTAEQEHEHGYHVSAVQIAIRQLTGKAGRIDYNDFSQVYYFREEV